MTPKEKARELFDKMYKEQGCDSLTESTEDVERRAKQCALICVNEFIRYTVSIYLTKDEEIDFTHSQYWRQVKEEIEKL